MVSYWSASLEFETQFLIILSFDLHTLKWILLQNIVQNDHFKLWLYFEYDVPSFTWISWDVPYHLKYFKPKKTKYSTKNVKMEIKTFKFLKEIFTRQLHYFIYQLILQNNHAQDIEFCGCVVNICHFFYHSLSDIFGVFFQVSAFKWSK